MPVRYTLILTFALSTLTLTSCRKAEPAAETNTKSGRQVQEVKVEVRGDGLAYLPGATAPFTGDAIEIYPDRTPAKAARRTPYVNGRKHGTMTRTTPGGRIIENRVYDNGRPLSSDVFYGNGKKKIAVQLNAKDMAEGPYKRWHDNGVLQAESTFDENEKFHGEEKDYDREGKLIGHYRIEHGKLKEILFETPEMKEERIRANTPKPAGENTNSAHEKP